MTDLRAQLQEGLGDSFALERELGRGGMATVFLALDTKHDRPVAPVSEGERGVALMPIDQLEKLLAVPYILSPGWLRIDPEFAPLRGNPRFRKLMEGTT